MPPTPTISCCSQDSEWIFDVWLFRLLLALPPPTDWGGGGPAPHLSNLSKFLWQQSCAGQPSTVPWGQNQLSILWKHFLKCVKLEQACEEAPYWCIADSLWPQKRTSLNPCLLLLRNKQYMHIWISFSCLFNQFKNPFIYHFLNFDSRLLVLGLGPSWTPGASVWGML